MERRAFICAVAGGLLATPLAAEAQQGRTMPRAGFLEASSRFVNQHFAGAFRPGLVGADPLDFFASPSCGCFLSS